MRRSTATTSRCCRSDVLSAHLPDTALRRAPVGPRDLPVRVPLRQVLALVVELVRDGIEEITARSIRTVEGDDRPADVIIYATGFVVPRMIWPLDIVGREGDEPVPGLWITPAEAEASGVPLYPLGLAELLAASA